jgi:predicted permease
MLSDLRYRLRALFRRNTVEQELTDELLFHIERESAKLEATGLSAEEARRQARLTFGGVEQIKELSRDGRGLSWLEAIGQDLRYALRALRRTPAFTLAVVITLGLGIGANAAMFGIVDRMLFRHPGTLRQADQVHRVYFASQYRGTERFNSNTMYTRYLDLERWTHSFSAIAAFRERTMAVGVGQGARELNVGLVSSSFFGFFDAPPFIGRYFNPSEDKAPDGSPVAVLGYAYWQNAFAGRNDILGQAVQIGTVSYTVIGVAPRGFSGVGDRTDPVAYIPITSYAGSVPQLRDTYATTYSWAWMRILVRRNPGVTVAQADADLTQAFQKSWQAEAALDQQTVPLAVARPRAVAAPFPEQRGPTQSTTTKVAGWVIGVSAIVLLIACANVANLLLARAVGRRREIALRLALGVSRARLAVQLLTESLLLASMGVVAGLVVAYYGDLVLRKLFLPDGDLQPSLLDGRTTLFTIVVAVIAGLLTGIAPILQSRRTDLNDTLKASARQGGHHRSRTRTGLVLLQGALCVVLLVGAGLFVRSLQQVRNIPLGFDPEHLIYFSPNFRGLKISQPERTALTQRLMELARATPGVASATGALTVPFWDTWAEGFFVDGIDSVGKLGEFTLQAGTPEYLATVGTKVLRGRSFDATDVAGSPPVVVIGKAMAQALWPDQEALGRCIRFGDALPLPCTTVIGVAEDIKQNNITDAVSLHYYVPLEQFVARRLASDASATLDVSLFVRVNGPAGEYAESLRRQLQSLMPGDSYINANTMAEIVGEQTQSWEVGATMFLAFAGLALVLAAIGLYSVIAYDVAQRTQELGVRMALGARVDDVVRMVVRDGIRFALLGLGVGGVASLLVGPYLAPLLYKQSVHDPLIFGMVAGVLLLIALLASAIPALRAARVNPSTALRAE